MKKLLSIFSITVAVLFASANTNAMNITNVFPHLRSTYELCQRVGFTDVSLASDQAKGQFRLEKENYQFLEEIGGKGDCTLWFKRSSRQLKQISYLYRSNNPTLTPNWRQLIENYNTCFGKCVVEETFKENWFKWQYEQYTIAVNLDDIYDTVIIIVSW